MRAGLLEFAFQGMMGSCRTLYPVFSPSSDDFVSCQIPEKRSVELFGICVLFGFGGGQRLQVLFRLAVVGYHFEENQTDQDVEHIHQHGPLVIPDQIVGVHGIALCLEQQLCEYGIAEWQSAAREVLGRELVYELRCGSSRCN